MDRSDLVFQELERRKAAIHRLLVNARILADELRGLARDNQAEIGPALQEVDDLLDMLIRKEKQLKATLDAVGPYSAILGNIIGTGPWFDAYVFNLATIPTGEFQPGGSGMNRDLAARQRTGARGRDRRAPARRHLLRGPRRRRGPHGDGPLPPRGERLRGLGGADPRRQGGPGDRRGPRGQLGAGRDGVRRRGEGSRGRQGRRHHPHAGGRPVRAADAGLHRWPGHAGRRRHPAPGQRRARGARPDLLQPARPVGGARTQRRQQGRDARPPAPRRRAQPRGRGTPAATR